MSTVLDIRQISIDYCAKSGVIGEACPTYTHIKALPWLSVIQAVKGSCTVTLSDGETVSVCEGDFIVTPSKCLHKLNIVGEDGIAFRYVYLSSRINGEYRFETVYDAPRVIHHSSDRGLCRTFDKLFRSDDLFEDYSCYYDILRVIFSLSRPKDERNEIPLERSVDFIERRYNEKMSVSDLAEQANLSLSRFYAVFNDAYGISPVSYINNFRLALAAELLLKSNENISDISSEVGIFDPIYFNKMFKRAYGVSPSSFRKLYKKV